MNTILQASVVCIPLEYASNSMHNIVHTTVVLSIL